MYVGKLANVHISSASTGKGRNIQKWNTASDLKLYMLRATSQPGPHFKADMCYPSSEAKNDSLRAAAGNDFRPQHS